MRVTELKRAQVTSYLCTLRLRSGRACALMLLCACALCLCGCVTLDVVEFFRLEEPPDYEQISESYRRTELKTSSSADVLSVIHRFPECELISQSESVVASLGQKKRGYKTWLNMVVFEENVLTAQRKYLFIVDEKPKFLFVSPWTYVRFDCEMVLDSEVLDEPYADENTRRIAILKRVLENARSDIKELGRDNKMIVVCGMIINQGLETILVKLDASSAVAARLDEPAGVEFEHMSFDKGRIKMVVVDDIVTVEMKLGSIVKKRLSLPADVLKRGQRQDETVDNTIIGNQ